MPKFNNTDILGYLRVTGETIIKEPTEDNHAATKKYVDDKIAELFNLLSNS